MFLSKKYFGLTMATTLSISLLVYACGGGGGSSSSGNTGTTGSKAASTSTTATQAALQVTSIGLNTGLSGLSSKPLISSKGSFGGRAKVLRDVFSAKTNRKILRALGTTTTKCDSGSGSETIAYPAGTHTFTITRTATNCVITLPQGLGSTVEDGTLVVTEVDNNYNGTDPSTDPNSATPNDLGDPAWHPTSKSVASDNGYTFTLKDANGNITEKFKLTGTDTVSFTLDGNQKPTSGTLNANMSLEVQSNNGTPNTTSDDTHVIFTLTNAAGTGNFSDSMTFDAWDSENHPTHIIDTISDGKIVIDDQIDNSNDVSVTFTNFGIDETITTNSGVDTDTIKISGQLSTACLGGAVTIATTTPVVVVGDACPTAGVITATDSASKVTTITFTSSGGVDIANPDGTTQHFAKCDDAKAC